MNSKNFKKIAKKQIDICLATLIGKANEYADKKNDDRLHNFHRGAMLREESVHELIA